MAGGRCDAYRGEVDDLARIPGPNRFELAWRGLTRGLSPLSWLEEDARRHGELFRYPAWGGGPGLVVVAGPEPARTVLERDAEGYSRGPTMERLAPVMGRSLLASEAPVWAPRRKALQAVLTRDRMGEAVRHAGNAASRLAARWAAGPEFRPPYPELRTLAIEGISQLVFGPLPDPVLAALGAALARTREAVHRRLVPGVGPWSGRSEARRRELEHAAAVLDAALSAARLHRSGGTAGESLVRDLEAIPGLPLAEELRALVQTGSLTTATAIAWTLVELSQAPRFQAPIAAESRAAAGGGDELRPLAQAAVDEALRLHPPVWAIDRKAVDDRELAGFRIPKGTVVVVAPGPIHRSPGIWPEPERFDPERFAPGGSPPGPGTYLPFGLGPRSCLGGWLARRMAARAVSQLVGDLEIEAAGPRPIPEVSLLATPGDAWRIAVRSR